MPRLNNGSPQNRRSDVPAQDDARRNPDGIYSGMTKRLAISDDAFCAVQNVPKDTRKRGRLA